MAADESAAGLYYFRELGEKFLKMEPKLKIDGYVWNEKVEEEIMSYSTELFKLISIKEFYETGLTVEIISYLKTLLSRRRKRTDYFVKKDIDVVNVLDEIITPKHFEHPSPLSVFKDKNELFALIANYFGVFSGKFQLNTINTIICIRDILQYFHGKKDRTLISLRGEEFNEFINMITDYLHVFGEDSKYPDRKRFEYFVKKSGKLRFFFNQILIVQYDEHLENERKMKAYFSMRANVGDKIQEFLSPNEMNFDSAFLD